jgi:hypothetical protein
MMFSQQFFLWLVASALAWTALGVLVLLILLLIDWRNGRLW